MYLLLMYCIQAVVCRLYEMLYTCICNVVISCWKSGAYGYVICRGGTDMCFLPASGWKRLDLEQYRISGLTILELYVDDVVGDHKNKMDVMHMKIRKIRKYALTKEAWYYYAVGAIGTFVAILIAFIIAFKCFR